MPADPVFEQMVERLARAGRSDKDWEWLLPSVREMQTARAREALTDLGVPELLERLAKVEAENRDLCEIAHAPTLLRDRTQMRERLERYETALREIEKAALRASVGPDPRRPMTALNLIAMEAGNALLPSENSNDDEGSGNDRE